jgi:hypothetical protein
VSPGSFTTPFTWAFRRPLAWWCLTTRSNSRLSPRAMSYRSASTMRWQ